MFRSKKLVKANKYRQVTSGKRGNALDISLIKPKVVKPRQSTLIESTSGESESEESASEESASEGSEPEESTSEKSASEGSEPEESTSEKSASEGSASDKSESEGSTSDESESKDSELDYSKSEVPKARKAKASEIKLSTPTPGELPSSQMSLTTLEEPKRTLANLPPDQEDGTLISEASTYVIPDLKESSVSYVVPEGTENNKDAVSIDTTQFKTPPRSSQSPPSAVSGSEDSKIVQEPKLSLAKRSSSTFRKLKTGKDTLKKPRRVVYELGRFRPVPADNIAGSSRGDSTRTKSSGWRRFCFGCLHKKRRGKAEFKDGTRTERYWGAH